MEPSFSVPKPMRTKPAETLTALPVEEPPGLYVSVSDSQEILYLDVDRLPSYRWGEVSFFKVNITVYIR